MKRQMHRAFPRRQRGTMLIISLIVLVAMTLAGIATMRSVDTAGTVAGNIGFRQSTVNAADQGLQAAYAWLVGNQNVFDMNSSTGHSTTNSLGYFPTVGSSDPDWTNNANWLEAALVNGGVPDAGNNIVSYRIDQLCTSVGVCGSTLASYAGSTGSPVDGTNKGDLDPHQGIARTHYRVTVRALGPRGSVAFVQALMRGE